MADIFLSYSRADRPIAQTIAESLEAEGFSVWWDKILQAGQTYDEVTESMLRDSSVVIVLWSHTSVKSKWVRAEATLGERSCVVIPAMIEDADRPIMFELTQSADLIGWAGDRAEPRWQQFVTDIRGALAQAAPASIPAAQAAATPDDANIETVFWTSIKDGTNPADFEAYLKRYPNGHYSSLARNRLIAISAPVTAAPIAPTPPRPTTPPPPQPAKSVASGSSSKWLMAALGVIALGAAGWGASTLLSGPASDAEAGVEVTAPETPAPPKTCETCPELVAIPAGSFMMGSPISEANRTGNEGPQREVTLPAFSMSKTEITYNQWAACVADNACRAPQNSGSGNLPVSSVSWSDALAYTRWLSSDTGQPYRLPTEAEWEYAARGGASSAYWWGDQFDRSIAVSGSARDVTTLTANAFGVSGMHGNLREWVEDCYVNNYAAAPTDGSAVLNGDCERRVVKGGAFSTGATEHRAANRARFRTSVRDKSLGFRVVQSGG